MKWAKEKENGEIEISKMKCTIGELCLFKDLIYHMSCGNYLENGEYFIREGICVVDGEDSDDIELIRI